MHRQLHCPSCSAEVLADHINIEKLVAACPACSTIFSFGKELQSKAPRKPEIMMPPGIEVFDWPDEMEITVRWRESLNGFLVFFTVFWNAILSIFVVGAFATGEYSMLLFTSIHLLIGVGLAYYTLAFFLNTTYVVVDTRELLIEHRPLRLPFYSNRNIPVAELKQFFVHRYVPSRTNGQPDYRFAVAAVTRAGDRLDLVKQLKKPSQARYIEQELERYLDIADERVEEEWVDR